MDYWKTGKNLITDLNTILAHLDKVVSSGAEHSIIIGADTQPMSGEVVFVKVICLLSNYPNSERLYFYNKSLKKIYYPNIKLRMIDECMESITLAENIKSFSALLYKNANICIHLDVNRPNTKTKTASISNMLVNMVKAYDIENVEIKPNSWAASAVADRHTKTRKGI